MLSPDQFHPHLNAYRDGGMGGDENHNVVGYVDTGFLGSMSGNSVSREGTKQYLAKMPPSVVRDGNGEGFKDPVMVIHDGARGRAYLGEGNHRVKAAQLAGISHVPTRVVRGQISDDHVAMIRKQGGRVAEFESGGSPWKDATGRDYWPSDMHPKHLYPEHTI